MCSGRRIRAASRAKRARPVGQEISPPGKTRTSVSCLSDGRPTFGRQVVGGIGGIRTRNRSLARRVPSQLGHDPFGVFPAEHGDSSWNRTSISWASTKRAHQIRLRVSYRLRTTLLFRSRIRSRGQSVQRGSNPRCLGGNQECDPQHFERKGRLLRTLP